MVLLQEVGGNLDVGVDGPQLELPAEPGVHIPDGVRHGPQILKHFLALLVKAPARFGELHPLVGAQKEGGPQLVLQQRQLAADRRLGHVELPGSPGDAPRLRHRGEILQLFEIHGVRSLPPPPGRVKARARAFAILFRYGKYIIQVLFILPCFC